jgi:catechol 2,3-dioxygenase-like lactoylglutathione lyase family enzyme
MISIRYLVNDVPESIAFYTKALGFELKQQFGPAMAILNKGGFTLWLAGPMSSAAQPLTNGQKPQPGGWNRFVLSVENLSELVQQLKAQNISFKSDIITGPGGSQILCEDPSGNVIELFQPKS